LRCNDQDFEKNLSLHSAGKAYSQREKYQLFAGVQPKVNHLLNFRRLTFHNSQGAPLEIDLALAMKVLRSGIVSREPMTPFA